MDTNDYYLNTRVNYIIYIKIARQPFLVVIFVLTLGFYLFFDACIFHIIKLIQYLLKKKID